MGSDPIYEAGGFKWGLTPFMNGGFHSHAWKMEDLTLSTVRGALQRA